jgi:hypothetical protein
MKSTEQPSGNKKKALNFGNVEKEKTMFCSF